VLLLPEPVRTQVEGIRVGLGADLSVPLHITLVAPVYVDEDAVDDAIAVVRAAADAQPKPLSITIGPTRTFLPINPVVYLAVNGDVDAVTELHDACRQGPLELRDEYEFTPHVTLIDGGSDEFLNAAATAAGAYSATMFLRSATLLEFGEDRVWRPIADAPFGGAPVTRTLGADAVTIRVGSHQSVAASHVGRYRSLVVEAFIGGQTAGVARGRVARGGVAWLDELIVVGESRGSGLGGALARAFVDAAREREATELRAARGATIAGFLVRMGFVQTPGDEFVLAL
jgi:2'-5' RNA ligase